MRLLFTNVCLCPCVCLCVPVCVCVVGIQFFDGGVGGAVVVPKKRTLFSLPVGPIEPGPPAVSRTHSHTQSN